MRGYEEENVSLLRKYKQIAVISQLEFKNSLK